jgi:hypothetical protein
VPFKKKGIRRAERPPGSSVTIAANAAIAEKFRLEGFDAERISLKETD